jgi:hypothetical protein
MLTPDDNVKKAARNELEARFRLHDAESLLAVAREAVREAEVALGAARKRQMDATLALNAAIEEQWTREASPPRAITRPPGVPLTQPAPPTSRNPYLTPPDSQSLMQLAEEIRAESAGPPGRTPGTR